MRVHGDTVISRRKGIEGLKDYRDAKGILKEDFHNLCGYCGKDGLIMHEKYHIDHFVPQSVDKGKTNDYYNLVLSCPKCNLSKSNKWPTQDTERANDGRIGFVNPATEEFDRHIVRNDKGYIEGVTPVGKYMCQALHFDIRRTDLYWRISEIKKMQRKLEQTFSNDGLEDEEKDFYIQTNILLNTYIDEAFSKGA